ncbi:very short patch repair endonuclease [Bradyrhizobium yuanmingense]|uniref:very short patch repair endonuclease n=1 Tax=Bradyrhizobium yuanmingense TaxID=108015 RepID=UPI0009DB22B9|nr:very short patch repair endonuclease [Bradyrhizobium yuanmingense]
MADIVTSEIRSRMMSGIRAKNTKPEITLRRLLHAEGFRFRLHQNLPGRPDLVFRKRRAVIFVHGCFWHRHECSIFKWPSTRAEFWRTKINGNALRDEKNIGLLLADGWRVSVVWECALRRDARKTARRCAAWLKGSRRTLTVD